MTRARWIQYGGLLAVAFVLSVGAGALIGRQRTSTPVATVPTPTPALTATATLSPALPTAALTPTPTSSPLPQTTPPTVAPSVTPSAAPTLDPPTAEDFADELLVALQSLDTTYLFDRLHPLVLERYGERQCRRHVNEFPPDPDASWTVLSSSGPAPWDWETDGLTTTVDDAWTLIVETDDDGQREIHFAPFEGTWRWFTDCGRPR